MVYSIILNEIEVDPHPLEHTYFLKDGQGLKWHRLLMFLLFLL